jgi:hypothetical protein
LRYREDEKESTIFRKEFTAPGGATIKKEGDWDSYHKTDALIIFNSANDTWYVALAAKNLKDEDVAGQITLANPQLGGAQSVQWQAPRTYNISVGYYFN